MKRNSVIQRIRKRTLEGYNVVTMKQKIGRILRSVLGKFDYVLWRRDSFRYGIDPFIDISRLSRAWGRDVRVFFDVGANDGGTLINALPVFDSAEFHAFEPHPSTFQRLKSRMSAPRASLHQLALSDQSGIVEFYEYGSEGQASLLNSLTPDARYAVRNGYESREITVESSTIDLFCERNSIDRIDVLKIDVEGFELSVLKGASGMFSAGKIGFVYAEFNDLFPQDGTTGGSLFPIAEYLNQFGLQYISTYTDFVATEGRLHVGANVLFAAQTWRISAEL